MTPTKLLVGQILVVFAIVTAGVWAATQWCAAMLGYLLRELPAHLQPYADGLAFGDKAENSAGEPESEEVHITK